MASKMRLYQLPSPKIPTKKKLFSRKTLLRVGTGAFILASLPLISELRIASANQPLTEDWRRIPIENRGSTLLGISFRALQAQTYGLDIHSTLDKLLEYPIQIIRLGAYWDKIESEKGIFDTSELDWEIDRIEQSGAKIILCVGALKCFGFPEYFIPSHYMAKPFANGTLITPTEHPDLLAAARNFITYIVERYKHRTSVIAWQLENEPGDPLPNARYWRISAEFLKTELETLRASDRMKPVMINGFLATSIAVKIGAAWLTQNQGNSLDLAKDVSDIIGIDYYPRVAITSVASETLYLNTSNTLMREGNRKNLVEWARLHGQKFMIAEGQAEPWEATIVPPTPKHQALYSCTPQNIIENYNFWAGSTECQPLYSYLFWGAEYWVLRSKYGDSQYLNAFARVLEKA